MSYGGIWCKFGGIKVPALSIEQYKLIKCITPPSQKPSRETTSDSTSRVFQPRTSREDTFAVIPRMTHPKSKDRVSKLTCRFIFTSSKAQIDIVGYLKSDNSFECSTPRHLLVDDEIILQVSFNNQDYYEVTTIENTLTFSEKARIM